jgi:hypothetical protein
MRISYSSSSEFSSCEQKWWYRKVANYPADADCADKKALGYGKAVHTIMERSQWIRPMSDSAASALIQAACEENDVHYQSAYYVAICACSLWAHHAASGLTIVGIEEELATPDFIGFIDAVAKDAAGRYWIIDLKTSSLMQDLTFARLAYDTQLNMYAHYRGLLEEKYPGITDNFAGCAYRVVQKPYEKKGKNCQMLKETLPSEEASVTTVFIVASDLDTAGTAMKFEAVAKRMNACTEPTRNRQSCVAWNTPCDYWSHCHGGKLKSECLENIVKHEGNSAFHAEDLGIEENGYDL